MPGTATSACAEAVMGRKAQAAQHCSNSPAAASCPAYPPSRTEHVGYVESITSSWILYGLMCSSTIGCNSIFPFQADAGKHSPTAVSVSVRLRIKTIRSWSIHRRLKYGPHSLVAKGLLFCILQSNLSAWH